MITEGANEKSYFSITIDGNTLKMDDGVVLRGSEDEELIFGKISAIFVPKTSSEGAPSLEINRFLRGRSASITVSANSKCSFLYSRPEETPAKRQAYHGKDELIASNQFEVFSADLVMNPCIILPESEYKTLSKSLQNTYYFVNFFDLYSRKVMLRPPADLGGRSIRRAWIERTLADRPDRAQSPLAPPPSRKKTPGKTKEEKEKEKDESNELSQELSALIASSHQIEAELSARKSSSSTKSPRLVKKSEKIPVLDLADADDMDIDGDAGSRNSTGKNKEGEQSSSNSSRKTSLDTPYKTPKRKRDQDEDRDEMHEDDSSQLIPNPKSSLKRKSDPFSSPLTATKKPRPVATPSPVFQSSLYSQWSQPSIGSQTQTPFAPSPIKLSPFKSEPRILPPKALNLVEEPDVVMMMDGEESKPAAEQIEIDDLEIPLTNSPKTRLRKKSDVENDNHTTKKREKEKELSKGDGATEKPKEKSASGTKSKMKPKSTRGKVDFDRSEKEESDVDVLNSSIALRTRRRSAGSPVPSPSKPSPSKSHRALDRSREEKAVKEDDERLKLRRSDRKTRVKKPIIDDDMDLDKDLDTLLGDINSNPPDSDYSSHEDLHDEAALVQSTPSSAMKTESKMRFSPRMNAGSKETKATRLKRLNHFPKVGDLDYENRVEVGLNADDEDGEMAGERKEEAEPEMLVDENALSLSKLIEKGRSSKATDFTPEREKEKEIFKASGKKEREIEKSKEKDRGKAPSGSKKALASIPASPRRRSDSIERSLDEVPSTRGDPESSNSESPKRTTISIINASNKIVPTGQRGGVLERLHKLAESDTLKSLSWGAAVPNDRFNTPAVFSSKHVKPDFFKPRKRLPLSKSLSLSSQAASKSSESATKQALSLSAAPSSNSKNMESKISASVLVIDSSDEERDEKGNKRLTPEADSTLSNIKAKIQLEGKEKRSKTMESGPEKGKEKEKEKRSKGEKEDKSLDTQEIMEMLSDTASQPIDVIIDKFTRSSKSSSKFKEDSQSPPKRLTQSRLNFKPSSQSSQDAVKERPQLKRKRVSEFPDSDDEFYAEEDDRKKAMKKRRAMTKGLFDNEMSASDSLQDFIVADDAELSEMEGPDIAEGELDRGDSEASELSDRAEEEQARTDAYVSDLIDKQQLSAVTRALPLKKSFEIFVQYLLSHALEPEDFEKILRNSKDSTATYYRVPLQKVEDEILGKNEALMSSSAWNQDFKTDLERFPLFRQFKEGREMIAEGVQCQACHRKSHYATVTVTLEGPIYDSRKFWAGKMWNNPPEDSVSAERSYQLGKHCATRTRIFHTLQHYKWFLYHRLKKELANLHEADPDLDTTKLLLTLMEKPGWLDKYFAEFKEIVRQAHEYGIEEKGY